MSVRVQVAKWQKAGQSLTCPTKPDEPGAVNAASGHVPRSSPLRPDEPSEIAGARKLLFQNSGALEYYPSISSPVHPEIVRECQLHVPDLCAMWLEMDLARQFATGSDRVGTVLRSNAYTVCSRHWDAFEPATGDAGLNCHLQLAGTLR